MSTTKHVNIIFGAQGQQVIATLNRIRSGIINTGNAASHANRQMGMFNSTLRAIGTTMRYAFAGSVVYGIASTVTALRDYNDVLATISTTAQKAGGAGSGILGLEGVRGIGQELQQISVDTAMPLEDLGDAVRTVYSSLQDITPEQATKFARLFAEGAAVSEASTYDFTNAVISMRNAFGLELKDMEMIAGQFNRVVNRSIGMTGDEWARQSGRVVAGAQAANIELDEMNTLMILATQQGGTAATNVRHLQQLLMSLRSPTQESLPLWASIGLGPAQLANLDGIEILKKIMENVNKRFGPGAVRATIHDDEIVANALTSAEAGITGPGAQFVSNLFGRKESERMFSVLFEQWAGSGPGNPGFDLFNKEVLDTEQNLQDVADRLEQRQTLLHMQRAGLAIRNYRIEFVRQFEDIIKEIDKGIMKFSEWEKAPLAGAITLGSIAAIVGLLKGRGAFGKLLGRVGVAGLAAGSLGAEQGPNGSLTSPFFVVVLNPNAWFNPKGGAPVPVPGGGGAGRPPVPGPPGRAPGRFGRVRGALGKIGRGLGRFRGFAGALAGGVPGAIAIGLGTELAFPEDANAYDYHFMYDKDLQTMPFQQAIKGTLWRASPQARAAYIAGLNANQQNVVAALQAAQKRRDADARNNIGAALHAGKPRGTQSVAGSPGAGLGMGGTIRIRLEPTAEAKRLVKGADVHVPYDHWSGGSYPSSRGGRPLRNAGQNPGPG